MNIPLTNKTINYLGHNITFPESGNVEVHINNILSDKIYPLFLPPEFVVRQIIDIGANIGISALYFALHYPNAQVFCYEPSASNFHFLELNTSGIKNIKIINLGLSDRTERRKLYLGRSQCLQHSIYPSTEVCNEFEYIELRSASQEISKHFANPCIIKIDTEGCEVMILKDIRNLLNQVSILYLEYHSEVDRLEIDQLLKVNFKLIYANAHLVHRGNLMYLANSLLDQFPELNQYEIKQQ